MLDETFMGPGLCAWVLRIERRDVMWLRYVLEASEGLALMSGGADGVVTLVAPHDQRAAVEQLLADLSQEMPLSVELNPARTDPADGTCHTAGRAAPGR